MKTQSGNPGFTPTNRVQVEATSLPSCSLFKIEHLIGFHVKPYLGGLKLWKGEEQRQKKQTNAPVASYMSASKPSTNWADDDTSSNEEMWVAYKYL